MALEQPEQPFAHPRRALSARELQVLEMTARGLTNSQIAEAIGVTIHGVKFHLASIYRKLGVANRTEAAALYYNGNVFLAGGLSEEAG